MCVCVRVHQGSRQEQIRGKKMITQLWTNSLSFKSIYVKEELHGVLMTVQI